MSTSVIIFFHFKNISTVLLFILYEHQHFDIENFNFSLKL